MDPLHQPLTRHAASDVLSAPASTHDCSLQTVHRTQLPFDRDFEASQVSNQTVAGHVRPASAMGDRWYTRICILINAVTRLLSRHSRICSTREQAYGMLWVTHVHATS